MSEFFKALEQADRDRLREQAGVEAAPDARPDLVEEVAPPEPAPARDERSPAWRLRPIAPAPSVDGRRPAEPVRPPAVTSAEPRRPREVVRPPVRLLPPAERAGVAQDQHYLVAEAKPRSPAAEAYRTIRTNIQFARVDRPVRFVVVTSSTSNEGKSTTAANFAVVCAEAGARVCLVDGDLRRPVLHQLLSVDQAPGLSDALVRRLALRDVAHHSRIPNVWVVPSGSTAPNPAELMGSNRMRELLQGSEDDFDMIICDTPPVISVADALALCAQSDGVLFVVRAGKVPTAVVQRAVDQINQVQGTVLGVVLNDVDLRHGDLADYYRHYKAYFDEPKP